MWVKEKSAIAGRKLNMIKTQITTSCPISSVSSLQSLSHVWIFVTPGVTAPGLPAHHKLQKFTQTHAHWVGDAIQASHLLSSLSPPASNITPWQIEGEKWKAVTHFTLLGSKITPDFVFGHRIRKKKCISWQKIYVKSSYVSKIRDTTSPTNVCIVKSIVFVVFKYGWLSRTIKVSERWRIDAFELWCWRRLLRGP